MKDHSATNPENTLSSQATLHFCPSCEMNGMSSFHELRSFPVHSVLNISTREQALNYPRGGILLGFCDKCGFISNMAFDPTLLEYSDSCEESQDFSPTFNEFSKRLATRLVERHDLHNKTILEIGCGKGEFLILLCELGNNRGIGFDPAYVVGRMQTQALERITFIKDFYSERYEDYHADFVCCKMTLEHIHSPADFVSMVRRSIGSRANTAVFFQVPDATRIFRDCAFEDIYYEHCSYFSPGSLERLFQKCGFDVLHLETAYGGQYLLVEAKPASGRGQPTLPQKNDLETVKGLVRTFQEKLQKKLSLWQKRLSDINSNGRRAVIWGSGSKGVAFLTTLKIDHQIKYVVDINPYRQGTYMAGTGQEIVAPDFLSEYQPDIVVVMNAVYQKEIERDLKRMGLVPKVLTL